MRSLMANLTMTLSWSGCALRTAFCRSMALSCFLPWAFATISKINSTNSALDSAIYPTCLEFKMHRRAVGVIRPPVFVDVLEGEGNLAYFKELFPSDALDPLAHALPLVGAFGVLNEDLADGRDHFRPAGRVVGQIGHRQLGEHGCALGVGYLAADQEGHAAFDGVEHRQGRAHGVAVAAVHAALVVDYHALDALVRMGPDGAGGTGGDGGGNFAQMAQPLVIHLGRRAVDPQDGDVGAVHLSLIHI